MCEIRPLYLTLPQITPELSMYDGVSCVWSGNTVAKATEIHCMLLSRSAQTKEAYSGGGSRGAWGSGPPPPPPPLFFVVGGGGPHNFIESGKTLPACVRKYHILVVA